MDTENPYRVIISEGEPLSDVSGPKNSSSHFGSIIVGGFVWIGGLLFFRGIGYPLVPGNYGTSFRVIIASFAFALMAAITNRWIISKNRTQRPT